MHPLRHITRANALAAAATLLLVLSPTAWSLIEYTEAERDTIVEMLEQLQERHYAGLAYGDDMSSQHLDNYIESLDSSKMFFTAADIADFEQYRTVMDEQLKQGKLDAGFAIFNRYHERLQARLNKVITTLPEAVAAMDFSLDESLPVSADDLHWASDDAQLDDRWRKQLKNQVLSLKLADKPKDEIGPSAEQPQWANQSAVRPAGQSLSRCGCGRTRSSPPPAASTGMSWP